MNFLFIYDHLKVGGIETLIVRMSNWMVDNGHNVQLLLKEGGALENLISEKVIICKSKEYFSSFKLKKVLRRKELMECMNNIDIIYTFRPNLVPFSLRLAGLLQGISPLVLTGLYHPDEVTRMGGPFKIKEFLYKYVYKKMLPQEAIFFMNQKCKENHENILKKKFQNSTIFPLPVDDRLIHCKVETRIPRKYKIVSIGNLKAFKSYNLYMMKIVKKLVDEGFDCTYNIYGEGELNGKMLALIRTFKIDKYVNIFPQIEYTEIKNILEDAYVFIGMGTSVVEAAFCRVPSIVARVYDEEGLTNGFIHDITDYNCGEIDKNIEGKDAFDLLKRLFVISNSEYEAICEQTRLSVEKYDIQIVMNNFLLKCNSLYNKGGGHSKSFIQSGLIHVIFYITNALETSFTFWGSVSRKMKRILGKMISHD